MDKLKEAWAALPRGLKIVIGAAIVMLILASAGG